jgi:hypothetical protein
MYLTCLRVTSKTEHISALSATRTDRMYASSLAKTQLVQTVLWRGRTEVWMDDECQVGQV